MVNKVQEQLVLRRLETDDEYARDILDFLLFERPRRTNKIIPGICSYDSHVNALGMVSISFTYWPR